MEAGTAGAGTGAGPGVGAGWGLRQPLMMRSNGIGRANTDAGASGGTRWNGIGRAAAQAIAAAEEPGGAESPRGECDEVWEDAWASVGTCGRAAAELGGAESPRGECGQESVGGCVGMCGTAQLVARQAWGFK